MNSNDLYVNALKIIREKWRVAGKEPKDKDILARLNKKGSFFSDKKGSVKGFSKEDLLWLLFCFRDILEIPNWEYIEAVGIVDGKAGDQAQESNSGVSGLPHTSAVKQLESIRDELLQVIVSLKEGSTPAVPDKASDQIVEHVGNIIENKRNNRGTKPAQGD